ncbi:MAG: hypothetical protein QM790_18905 [Nibricoccus sp.]
MSLENKISEFLAQADTKPAASKLEPYAELIRTLRQRRWTYQQIAIAMKEQFGVTVAASTMHNFVKVRAKKKLVIGTSKSCPPAADFKRPRFNLDA